MGVRVRVRVIVRVRVTVKCSPQTWSRARGSHQSNNLTWSADRSDPPAFQHSPRIRVWLRVEGVGYRYLT